MSYTLKTTPYFDKGVKRLVKKYPSLLSDIVELGQSLLKDPVQGIPLGKNCYKIRMAITSKWHGKSGGARIVYYVRVLEDTILLMEIFDKSDKANITDKELLELLKHL